MMLDKYLLSKDLGIIGKDHFNCVDIWDFTERVDHLVFDKISPHNLTLMINVFIKLKEKRSIYIL
jgi:hypothetical protein